MLYSRGSREWAQAAFTADQMALAMICMSRSGVPELATQSSEPVVSAYEHQSRALTEVIRLIVPEADVEALYQYLVSGSSALTWKNR